MKSSNTKWPLSIDDLTVAFLDRLLVFHPEGKKPPPIEAEFDKGKGRLLIITGENASGKSFLRRLFTIAYRENKVEVMDVSQQRRVGGGFSSAFIFGDESWESTGYLSGKAVQGGIETCQNREKPHVIIWDEPDIGLSESYASGVGLIIQAFILKLPKHTKAVIVTTHSRPLLSQLVDLEPHHLRLGGHPPLKEWLSSTVVKPKDLDDLQEESLARFRMITKIMQE